MRKLTETYITPVFTFLFIQQNNRKEDLQYEYGTLGGEVSGTP